MHVASIAKDGLLVVRRCDPLAPPNELNIVPRSVLDGLVTALHIKLDHPSKHQLDLVLKRHFYALDMPKASEQANDSCHTCASLKLFPNSLVEQSSEDPSDLVGISYVATVLKRNRQLILVVRETVTSYTSKCFIKDEQLGSLRDGKKTPNFDENIFDLERLKLSKLQNKIIPELDLQNKEITKATPTETESAIWKLNTGKASDENGIVSEHYIRAFDVITDEITDIINHNF
ncbi:unnamed protein product [Mytilus coruscus]|uniref:Uncharacterized protein n=1 Tax=Mytilus coruscus TaxID=42192 RepID=A0A6J8BKM4_MYTCO|nr:unnamed protein product [Mytilus coruscus]